MFSVRGAALALLGLALVQPARADTVFVSNEKSNTISVVDGGKMQVIATIKVGRRPRGITFNRDMTRIFVCVGDDNRIDVIDLATQKVVDRMPSGPDPELFVLEPQGRLLYIANEDDNMVSVLDTDTKKIVGEIQVGVEPEGMGISPDGKFLVNTSETTNMAHFIDTASHKIVDNVLVDARPRVAQFTGDGRFVWVSAEVGGTVSVIDTATRKVVHKIGFAVQGVPREAIQPVGIQMTRDGQRAFVALGPANRVAEIDARTYEVKRYHLVGQRVWNLALSPDEKRLYTTNGVSNDMSILDMERGRVIKSVAVGGAPWGVIVKP